MSDKRSRDYDYTSSASDILHRKPTRSFSMKSQKPPEVKLRSILAKAVTHFDRANDDDVKAKYINEMWEVVEAAWQLPVIGRDLAYEISDTLRREKLVAFLVSSLQVNVANNNLQRECARLLSQILTTDNRHYVSKNATEILTKFTQKRDDLDLIRINISILESLFKDSEGTSTRLIDLGALDTVIHACRHDDLWTARHCAAALANAAIFGGSINHKRMVDKGAPEWLFPLAFRTDDFCRFYACLAVTVLAANPLVEKAVVKSGTLELVEPFVQSHDPYEFAQANSSHAQGRSASFLQRMIPLLISGRPEAQALASFYFAMEASIKAKQQKTQVFSEVASIIPLKRVIATSRSNIARILAARCLKIIGEDVPRKLSPQIHLWDMEDVQSWLTVAGFRAFHSSFRASTVDGEMLLLLTEKELKEDLDMSNNVHRKRFMRDLNRLRAGADYRSVDTTGICEWLCQIDPKFAQYMYSLLQAGIDRPFLPKLTDAHLRDDCGIENGVHRTRILAAVQGLGTNAATGEIVDPADIHDVFISYRRKNGSHLASLLKVHLQLRGFRVFLDVESLQEGDFADRTLKSVRAVSAGFVLILTAGALDKCAIDHEGTDWLHKEIVTAISNRRNIVPVTTETFQWPLPDDLPQDMSQICFYNGVKWVHEYQDACVDKILRFLKGQDPPSGKLSRIASVQSGRSGLGASKKIRSTHPNAAVRPSRSSDNLMDSDRVPRPRQRASPPGQASQSSAPNLPVSRGVTGAQSEDMRSLDQGDGASAPYDQAQYQPKPKSPTAKAPDLATSSSSKKNIASPSSASSASTSSSKNPSSPLKTDVIRLDEIIAKERERSQLSESDVSSDYSSSGESEGWEPNVEERGGADGKNKQDIKPAPPVKPSPANVRTVVADVEKSPEVDANKTAKTTGKKPSESEPSKSPPKQSSPEKPKPSNKYKAPPPPPPSYEAAKEMPVAHGHRSTSSRTPEPDRRPTPTPRDPPTTARSEPGDVREHKTNPPNGKVNSKPMPAKSTPNVAPAPKAFVVKSEPATGAKPASNAAASHPKPVSKPPKNEISRSNAAAERIPKAASSVPKPDGKSSKAPHTNPPNMVEKPARSSPAMSKPVPLAKPEESSSSEDTRSISDVSDSSSSYSGQERRSSNYLRTNADGNDGASSGSSRSRSTMSTPSDLYEAAPPQKEMPKKVNSNTNNNNNVAVNGVGTRKAEMPPNANSQPDLRAKNGTRPSALPKSNSTRSTPLNRSSHSIASADAYSPPRSPTKIAPPGAGKPIARRDVAPPNANPAPRRSASERLQITRPPPPSYPIGSSFTPPVTSHRHNQPPNPSNPGYNMDQYKAAMAASIRAPYPGHQVYPHSKARPGPPPHGFDTAV